MKNTLICTVSSRSGRFLVMEKNQISSSPDGIKMDKSKIEIVY